MDGRVIAKAFVITPLFALFLLLNLFWAYFTSIILAFIISSAFYPLYMRVCGFLGGRKRLSALLVLIIPVGSLLRSLSTEALDFYEKTMESVSLKKVQQAIQGDSVWAGHLRRAQKIFGIKVDAKTVESLAVFLVRNFGFYLSTQISAIGSNFLSFLVHFFLMLLMTYYLLSDGIRLKNYVFDLLPFPSEQTISIGWNTETFSPEELKRSGDTTPGSVLMQ